MYEEQAHSDKINSVFPTKYNNTILIFRNNIFTTAAEFLH